MSLRDFPCLVRESLKDTDESGPELSDVDDGVVCEPHANWMCFTLNLLEGRTTQEVESIFTEWVEHEGVYSLFVVREVGTEFGFHYHGVIGCRWNVQSFRMMFVRKFNISNKECTSKRYNVKSYDASKGYLKYMCKGMNGFKGDDVYVVVDTEDRDVKALHEQYYADRDAVILEREAARKKKKGNRFIDELMEYVYSELQADPELVIETKEDVLNVVERFYMRSCEHKKRLLVDPGIVIKWCEAVYGELHSVKASIDLFARVRSRWLIG